MLSKEEYAKVSRSMNIVSDIDKSLVELYNFLSGTASKENNVTLLTSMNTISNIIFKTRNLMNVLCQTQHNCTTFSASRNVIGVCLSDKLLKIFEENGYVDADEIAYHINCKLLEEADNYIGSEDDKKGSEKLSDVPRVNIIGAHNDTNPIPRYAYPYPSNLFDPNVSMNYWNQFMSPMTMGEGNNNAPQQYNPPKMKPEDMKKGVTIEFKKNREGFNNEANTKA